MIEDDMYLVDSNILIYAFDISETKKYLIAKSILKDCFLRKRKLVVSLQNLSEFFVNVTKKIPKPISAIIAREIIEKIVFFKEFRILEVKPNTIINAINISEKYKLHYWDALIIATMKENSVFNVYTENVSDFNKVEGINAVDPFKKEIEI